MNTVVGLMLALSPFVLTAVLLLAVERRQRRRQVEVTRQIALTDALHARLGAVVAPVVRQDGRRWTIDVAVPMERLAIVSAVLATVHDVFGRAAYEVRLHRQTPAPERPSRRAPARVRELSWT